MAGASWGMGEWIPTVVPYIIPVVVPITHSRMELLAFGLCGCSTCQSSNPAYANSCAAFAVLLFVVIKCSWPLSMPFALPLFVFLLGDGRVLGLAKNTYRTYCK